jgi:hypothetical protein
MCLPSLYFFNLLKILVFFTRNRIQDLAVKITETCPWSQLGVEHFFLPMSIEESAPLVMTEWVTSHVVKQSLEEIPLDDLWKTRVAISDISRAESLLQAFRICA